MESLPSELLVAILSFVDADELFELRQVSTRWQTSIDECRGLWRRKRSITEDDLGVYLSLESKVTRLIYFLKRLSTIDYFFFPMLWDARVSECVHLDITKETGKCLRTLYVLLKKLLNEGRIPVHLDAIHFIQNMLPPRKDLSLRDWRKQSFNPDYFESQCSVSKCRSIIVPVWPPDKHHFDSYEPWLDYLPLLMGSNLEEIIIEKMNTHAYRVQGDWPSFRYEDSGRNIYYGPSRVRVFSVMGDEHHNLPSFLPSVRLRPDLQLFSYSEFTRLVRKLRNIRVTDALELVLDKLQAEGRVQDCQIGEQHRHDYIYSNIDAPHLLSALRGQRDSSYPMLGYEPLLREMAQSPITHLAVHVALSVDREQPASVPLDFLRSDPFRAVTRLNLSLWPSSADRLSEDGRLYIWNCLLQEDILTRMQFLRVSVNDCWSNEQRDSPAAAVSTIALPRLESLELRYTGSAVHVCALLRGTPNLRCLRLDMYGLASDVVLRDSLLSAISQLTRLVSLTIELREAKESQNSIDTCSWMTRSSTSTSVHLCEEVFVALSHLVHLDSLSIRFPHEWKLFRSSAPIWMYDMRRLTAMLPRLRAVVLCNRVVNQSGQLLQ